MNGSTSTDAATVTHEELAMMSKAGDTDARDLLWERTRRLIIKLIMRYRWAVAAHGYDVDDLEQSAYLAMLYAIRHYSPAKEWAFNTYLYRAVQAAIRDLMGWRVYTERLPPAVSLQTPLTWLEDEIEMQDNISDPAAELDFEISEIEMTVHDAIQRQLDSLSQQIIYMRYWKELSREQTANQLGLDAKQVSKMEAQAIRALRKPEIARPLADFYGYKYHMPARSYG